MVPDRVSNPGPLTYESGALPIALRGPALTMLVNAQTSWGWVASLHINCFIIYLLTALSSSFAPVGHCQSTRSQFLTRISIMLRRNNHDDVKTEVNEEKHFCLSKSEVSVERVSVCNFVENLVEHGIHCLQYSYTNDVIDLLQHNYDVILSRY